VPGNDDIQQAAPLRSRAWFAASLHEFSAESPDAIFGRLARNSEFAVERTQGDAWAGQVEVLQAALSGLRGRILLEFNIPRMGRRVDAVVLTGPVVFAIEFKVGARAADRAAVDQVWDYALDLKNFHAGSHAAFVTPILVATQAPARIVAAPAMADDLVFEPIAVGAGDLRQAIDAVLAAAHGPDIDPTSWEAAPYLPTPTIIEAARALYAQHSVEAIARSDAEAQNLAITSGRIEQIVHDARTKGFKAICFVTGVPGAGKTLVGLNVATRQHEKGATENAVFLSGNGPLVSVLREALTRDEVARRKQLGENPRKGKVAESVKAFIQNVHHFRDDALVHPAAPPEHVAVFDEAQRAWNLQQTANFMQRKKGQPGFSQSEPEFLISCMDRHKDWAVVIGLVGGGQEINTGEAGIEAWLEAVRDKFPHWRMFVSSKLTDSEYGDAGKLKQAISSANCSPEDCLHLGVSMRSFRAENVSHFVKALLDLNTRDARDVLAQLDPRYPIRITRSLAAGKAWVREQARGNERYGLVCSSKAMRLKPHAIDVRYNVNPVHWFLNERDDPRSSYFLEDAATEFQVQGLELDWACVTWDADLRATSEAWSYHDFRGDRWVNIHSEANRRYLLNAYRVLLTRARQGMAIVVPPGNDTDATRTPAWYDATYEYLKSVGLQELAG
jgi:hypothetical protein